MTDTLYLLWLHLIPGVGPYLIRSLFSHFDTAQAIYESTFTHLIKIPHIGPSTANKILTHRSLDCAKHILTYCTENHIQLISFQDTIYPTILHLYMQSPTLLYVKGDLKPLNLYPVATTIVGARRCNTYGKEATLELATRLARENIPVISGMAKGIDSYAHTAALHANGYTAAVVGTGLDRCYPVEHITLMKQISLKGAVISQFPPFSNVHKQNFARRNELMAMLSQSIYVMQATSTSGSLYTAECGFKLGKDVYVLPGNIYDPLHEGSHALFLKGAKPYVSIASNCTSSVTPTLPATHKKICKLLQTSSLSIDQLHTKLQLDLHVLEEALLSLELNNILYQAGGYIHLNKMNT
nr:DNA-processing protein DprA [uncultured Niameybacter sp.]